jgi:hypothetical protein
LVDEKPIQYAKNIYEETNLSDRDKQPKSEPEIPEKEDHSQDCFSLSQDCLVHETNLSDVHNTYTILANTKQNTSSSSSVPNEPKAKPDKKSGGGGIFFCQDQKKFMNITGEFMELMKRTYPGVDIERELLKMVAWLTNPENPKRDGKQAFISKWLSKADIVPVQSNPEPIAPPPPNAYDEAFMSAIKRRNEEAKKHKDKTNPQDEKI